MRATGKIQATTAAAIALGIGALYWCIIFIPVYLDNMDVTDAVNVAFNAWGHEAEESTRNALYARLREVKWTTHVEKDDFGDDVTVGGLAVSENNPFIEEDKDANTLEIRYSYERVVKLPPTDKVKVMRFSIVKKGKAKK